MPLPLPWVVLVFLIASTRASLVVNLFFVSAIGLLALVPTVAKKTDFGLPQIVAGICDRYGLALREGAALDDAYVGAGDHWIVCEIDGVDGYCG